ncbi:class I SAM-dependent methyltransferase [Hyphococcus luteus]|uniref:Methyltransferase type 11 domain-containing protein n=1 Tax=Hyphococcus luteus TaxID=2058213 RepID=A0A2S7K5Q7_9PROT|nr:methyltransferase domain-containing protein [Marinicaulis flavus]PQA87845.1 hypothetical protein CW354_05690 [Marinicaulis flavus]
MTKSQDVESWRAYWRGAKAAGVDARDPQAAVLAGGAKGPALDDFWTGFFGSRLEPAPAMMLDAACGAGAVSAQAAALANERGAPLSIHCTDYSAAAVSSALQMLPESAAGFAADCAALPLAPDSYDIAVSQFGLEYAGPDAFKEAARVLRPGGHFAAVVHLKGGAIADECAANLSIVRGIEEIELLSRAKEAFRAGFAVLAGRAPQSAYQTANKAFGEAVEGAKTLIKESPQVAALAFLQRIYADLAHMYPRLKAYAPQDIETWIDRGEFELGAYEHRMSSMLAAAQSQSDMASLKERLQGAGVEAGAPAILEMGSPSRPAAWTLVGLKRA